MPAQPRFRSNHSEALLEAAIDGLGLAHLPTWLAADALREPRGEERDEPRRARTAARLLTQHVDRRRLGRRRVLRQQRAQPSVAQRVR
ncbi:LysR substrate-binding domain-containing protein, partial [Burkholderia cenocepacia]